MTYKNLAEPGPIDTRRELYGARRRRGHVTQDSGRWKAQDVDWYRRLNFAFAFKYSISLSA